MKFTIKYMINALRRLSGNTVNRDIALLVVISIVLGSLGATVVSSSADLYFKKTLASVVGEYGEYDLVVQVREEMREEAAQQLQSILSAAFAGARLKEGPTLTGKTSFFIALPDEYRSKEVYENLGKTFGSVPGGAGVGVLTEPRLTIRGVPEGARNMVIEQIMAMSGVKFAFHDGAAIGVVLTAPSEAAGVATNIKSWLDQYQLLEISFPVGGEPENPIRLGQEIAAMIKDRLQADTAQNVSVDGKSDDMTYTVSTMMELRKFLAAYATIVTISPAQGVELLKGDMVVFSNMQQVAGGNVDPQAVWVEITDVSNRSAVEGRIVQGNSQQLLGTRGYKIMNQQASEYAGTASFRNPREALGQALESSAVLAGKLPAMTTSGHQLTASAQQSINRYDHSVANMQRLLGQLGKAADVFDEAGARLNTDTLSSVEQQLKQSVGAVNTAANAAKLISLAVPGVHPALMGLSDTQEQLAGLQQTIHGITEAAATAAEARSSLRALQMTGQSALAQLVVIDQKELQQQLANVDKQLADIEHIDANSIVQQSLYMSKAMPLLSDADISHSLKTLDKFIAGQVIPGERIQLLLDRRINATEATALVYEQTGQTGVSVYTTAVGIIEPNPRGEIYQLLGQIKAVLVGLSAIVMTIAFLLFDHTAVMTVIRQRRLRIRIQRRGWQRLLYRVMVSVTAPERSYGMLIGALLLTGMFSVAGGAIPYLPWFGIPLLGALFGNVAAAYTEKVNPLSPQEFMAGQALGFSFDQIMREIVLPGARPGLWQLLNSRHVILSARGKKHAENSKTE